MFAISMCITKLSTKKVVSDFREDFKARNTEKTTTVQSFSTTYSISQMPSAMFYWPE